MTPNQEAKQRRNDKIWQMFHDPQYTHLSKNMRHELIGKTVFLSTQGVRTALGRMKENK